MIQDATNSGHPTYNELVSFGCTIPNCRNTVWSETKSEVFAYDMIDLFHGIVDKTEIHQYFPTKAEV